MGQLDIECSAGNITAPLPPPKPNLLGTVPSESRLATVLQAMLRKKLSRPEEGMEDLLTSNTFGVLKYLPDACILLEFLRRSVNPLTRLRLGEMLAGIDRVERWRFWPSLAGANCLPCEPDVEIILSDGECKRVGILIEAKYRSGKSSFASDEHDAKRSACS